MATHSSILAWRIPWTEKPGGLQSMGGLKESDTTDRLILSLFLHRMGQKALKGILYVISKFYILKHFEANVKNHVHFCFQFY